MHVLPTVHVMGPQSYMWPSADRENLDTGDRGHREAFSMLQGSRLAGICSSESRP